MDPIFFDLLVVLVLVLVNAAFAGTELAVVSLRRSQIVRLSRENGRRGRTLLALSDEPTSFLSTIQVGITLAGFLASAFAAVSLSKPVEEWLEFLGGAAPTTALVLVTLALTFISLVFGELVPKRVAMRRAERWALAAAVPVSGLARAARPIVWLLTRSTDFVARIVGGGAGEDGENALMSDEEVMDVIATETSIDPTRRSIVEGAIELQERTVREVLVPRRDVFVLDAAMSIADAARSLANNGHSRAPVGDDGTLDELHGIVHIATLVASDTPDATLVGVPDEPTIVPEGARVQHVLALLQRERRQMALVADEHGSIVGIVTMEDLLEEIVGELYDELDRDLAPDDPRGYSQLADGSFELPGTFPVHDLPDLGLPLPAGAVAATVGGLLLDALGHLPGAGELVVTGELELTALAVDGTAITRVRIRRT